MAKYSFRVYYDPNLIKKDPFRAAKDACQIKNELSGFDSVLEHYLTSTDSTSSVFSTDINPAENSITVEAVTSLDIDYFHRITDICLNYCELYGGPVQQMAE